MSSRDQQRPPIRRWANRVAAWVLLAGSIILGVEVFDLDARATALQEHGLTASATLLEVHTGARGDQSYVVAEYPTAGGRWITTPVHTFEMHPAPRPGETATVLYDPDHPRSNVVDARLGPDRVTTWFLTGLSIVSGALVVPTLRRGVDWDQVGD